MSAQHTPGPWFFDGPPDNHIVWSDRENRICFMAHSNGITPDRDTANARLIAAAPELLEALEDVVRFHRGEGEYDFRALTAHDRANATYDAWQAVLVGIDAAFAKARGAA